VVDERVLISVLEALRELPKGIKIVSDRISQCAAVSALQEGQSVGLMGEMDAPGGGWEGELEEEGQMERVHVCLRLKPEESGSELAWHPRGESELVSSSGEVTRVDAVLPQSSSGDEVYAAAARRVVSGARRGVSGVVLAYGATSSGKTHTMQEISSRAASELSALFGAMHFSALEVYNEELCDLLTSSHSRRSGAKTPRLLSSSSDNGASQHTTVANAREVSVESSHHLQRLLDSVQARRATGRHLMNERSSRSHLVIKLALPNGADVHLVDLAGSERVANTGALAQTGAPISTAPCLCLVLCSNASATVAPIDTTRPSGRASSRGCSHPRLAEVLEPLLSAAYLRLPRPSTRPAILSLSLTTPRPS
jgi:hypothetical protein